MDFKDLETMLYPAAFSTHNKDNGPDYHLCGAPNCNQLVHHKKVILTMRDTHVFIWSCCELHGGWKRTVREVVQHQLRLK